MGYPTDSENMEDGEKLLQEETEEREGNGGKEEGGKGMIHVTRSPVGL